MIKKIAFSIATLGLFSSLASLFPIENSELTLPKIETTAIQTEGPCMSKVLNKAPKFFANEKCRLG